MTKRRTRKPTFLAQIGNVFRAIITAVVLVIGAILAFVFGNNQLGNNVNQTPPVVISTVAPGTEIASVPGIVSAIPIQQGFGAQKGFWQVYFTAPTGSSDSSAYVGGIDTALVTAIGATTRTLDIAAYEFNNRVITQAVLDARRRNVQVRVVTDDDDGLGDDETTLRQLTRAGIQVVTDDRNDLMHDKFMILDGTTVWTGSWNYTINDTYRNNNNALTLRSRQAVQDYQAEFNEMFTQGQFGPTSPANTPSTQFTQDGISIQIYFSPEDRPVPAMVSTIQGAQRSIRFMTFSFTLDEIGDALLQEAQSHVNVQGIFETTGSETQFSELTPLFCAGLAVRQDGNPYILHHKVFIIDDQTVITGSFNVSANATDSNDENLLIIRDADLAAQYVAEFNRRWAEATTPGGLTC
jgi:phosphatidylserine/phosphatidylglycerophosphate/cardiolipin synthase-like enzyme